MKKEQNIREEILRNIQKIVVKVGTSTLTKEDGNLDGEKIKKIVLELSNLSDKGYDIVLVTSGAIGAGMGKLNMSERPKTLSEKQALASVGQVALTHLYQVLFQEHNKIIGQLLLTKGDFSDRRRYLNARNVCNTLLSNKIIPVVNENDAVVSDEIKVGDNDTLSALVAGLIDADLLIILSDVQGLYNKNPQKYKDANLIEIVGNINEDIKKNAGGEGTKFGTGGMVTKIIAAEMATKIGTHLIIASGDDPENITRIVEKENIGTLFVKKHKKISSKKYWLAYGTNKKGVLTIDEGAEKALYKGKSLLPVGVKSIEGIFSKGAVTKIENLKGEVIAMGISNYSSEEINLIKGRHSEDIENILGHKYADEAVHIDNLTILQK
ncbi:glutamate 5-kinase [Leptotrichia sp. OH3620_COT-345]|uniref:glutamate 5-kinase n=1 Tax=Leptotrichia sp. OH3620_COT-345 TaxID=2491048 RepID=UPI000F64984D|nr:glutamate 5-kinase [Leptotrichia sp. OH3620_COT-345]RRD40479.1 glutamate 5-kinase [Leptotrichia sp. OH3620_COT-345]